MCSVEWIADGGFDDNIFQEGDKITALVYLELATRAGVRAGRHLKDVIREQLSPTSRYSAMLLLESWRALPSSSWIILLKVCSTHPINSLHHWGLDVSLSRSGASFVYIADGELSSFVYVLSCTPLVLDWWSNVL